MMNDVPYTDAQLWNILDPFPMHTPMFLFDIPRMRDLVPVIPVWLIRGIQRLNVLDKTLLPYEYELAQE